MNYENVFESIKLNLVPVSIHEESKKEISRLKLELQNAKNDFNKLKLEYKEQKMTIDIIQAEKESLEAEKKTSEVKFQEVSLKLKQKTHQYNSLLKTSDCNSHAIQKVSAGTHTIKEEPNEIGVVNVPASLSSKTNQQAAKAGTKRKHSMSTISSDGEKRNIYSNSSQLFTTKFTCENCLDDWGKRIDWEFDGNPNHKYVPDPKIRVFASFELYREHVLFHHRSYNRHSWINKLCSKSKCCLRDKKHNAKKNNASLYVVAPHGDIVCKLCDLSFKLKEHHDLHVKIEHFGYGSPYTAPFLTGSTKKEMFDLWLLKKSL